MSKKAMKLALEALEADYLAMVPDRDGHMVYLEDQAITALREALAKPDFWEGYEPEPDSTCNNTLRAQGKAYPRTCKKCGFGPCVGLAQQALDKKAENARELGLDYEPAQQEPVAYPEGDIVGPCICGSWPGGKCLKCPRITAPAQRTWVGLTDEELSEVYNQADWDTVNGWEYERAIEAKLKEKNNG